VGGNVGESEGDGRDSGTGFREEQSPMGDAGIAEGRWGNVSEGEECTGFVGLFACGLFDQRGWGRRDSEKIDSGLGGGD
jgi:hypothetical protein